MQNFMPHYKKQSHAITADGLQFLKDFGKVSNYNGYIQIALKNDTKFKTICFVYLQNLADYVSKMELYPSKNYYLTATSFTKMERSYETMFSYNAIVIDIDCHVNSITMQERERLINDFIWRFGNDCIQCGDLISPNYIVLTGRGVQLWWFITPVYAPQFKNCISDISAHFIGIIQNLLDEFPSELTGLEIDVVASTNPIGLYRMPGSTNPNAGKEVRVLHLSDKRLDPKSYRDKYLPCIPQTSHPVSKKKGVTTTQDQSEWFKHLLDVVKKIRDLRAAPIGSELRNNYIYLFYCIAKSLHSADVAMRLTEEFNSGFRVPFRTQELKSTLSSAVRKKYDIGPETIIRLLNVTDEEANLVGLDSRQFQTETLAKNKKAERNEKILALFLSGTKQKDIANAIGVTPQTVSTVLKSQNAECLLVVKTKLLADSGMTTEEIAQQMCCTSRTVRNRLATAITMSPVDFEMAEKNLKNRLYTGCILSPISRQEEQGALGEAATTAATMRLGKVVLRCLRHAAKSEGSLCLPESILLERVVALRKKAKPNEIIATCRSLLDDGHVKCLNDPSGVRFFYLTENYKLESAVAEEISKLIKAEKSSPIPANEIDFLLSLYEQEHQMTLSVEQKEAVVAALTSPTCVITGGPGTGKTAVADAICSLISYHDPKAQIKLCAPTGKASIRLTEATGRKATTIHSLLSAHFAKCDYIIVDELSMVNMELFVALLQEIPPSARLITLGDPNQLPCIGMGNILHDLIAARYVPTVELKTVFRQSKDSGIAKFAAVISNQAELDMALSLVGTSLADEISFQCVDYPNDSVVSSVSHIIADLTNLYGIQVHEIQILAPTKACVDEINIGLRGFLNPAVYGQTTADSESLMPGDRVLYCKNDYARRLFNGSTGIVKKTDAQNVTVEYANQRIVRHDMSEVTEKTLVLAYAITIHKAQGSEYPVTIIPIYESMDRILTRNLIYTAITRAKKKCILVGEKAALERALQCTLEGTHLSRLMHRLSQNLDQEN